MHLRSRFALRRSLHGVSVVVSLAVFSLALVVPGVALANGGLPGTVYGAIHHKAQQAFQALHQRQPAVEAHWQSQQPGVQMLLGLDEALPGKTPEERALGFLRANEALLGVSAADLRPMAPSVSRQRTVLRFQQVAHLEGGDVRVLDAEVSLTFDNANGQLLRLVSSAMPVLAVSRGPMTREAAVAKASASVAGATFARGSAAAAEEGVIANATGAQHVWIVHVPGASLQDLKTLAVNSQTGAVTRMPNRITD